MLISNSSIIGMNFPAVDINESNKLRVSLNSSISDIVSLISGLMLLSNIYFIKNPIDSML